MKKITLALVAMIGYAAITAQPTRLVLFEEFTQASCGPCASQNPAFNALLAANSAKAISIKYQTSWPGVDPMNAANPADAATRVSYYSVSGVPWSAMDGVAPTGSSYSGAPANATAAAINTRYAVAPGLALLATHTLNSTYDSVQIAVNISNSTSSAFSSGSSGSLKLHTVIVEEEINYATAPGSNGESDFYSVMRKMLPNAGGTTLADSWAIGASQTFSFNVALPTYIANLGEVAIVAFVQDDNNKDVVNAAYSAPQTVSNLPDAGIQSVSASTGGLCDPYLTPSVTIENAGSLTITSADVAYTLNGGTPVSQAWSGSISAGQTATITFPQTTISGSTQFIATVTNPNGTADYNGMNNTSSTVTISALDPTPTATPYNEGFQSHALGDSPNNDFIYAYSSASAPRVFAVNQGISNGVNWNLGGHGQSTMSMRWDFPTIAPNTSAYIITKKMNLSTLSSPKLFMTHAYAKRGGSSADQFKISVSTDCGSTWNSLFAPGGNALVTGADPGAQYRFYPQASEWVTTELNLAAYASATEAIFKFEGISGGHQAFYLDNIWVANSALGLDEISLPASITAYPNPATDVANVEVELNKEATIAVSIYNTAGQLVISIDAETFTAGNHVIAMDVKDLATGLYTAQVTIDGAIRSIRLSVAH